MESEDRRGRRRAWRAALLGALYDRVEGSVSEFVAGYEVARALDIDDEEARRIVEYLEEKGYVRVDDHREGILRLTAAGVDAVESS